MNKRRKLIVVLCVPHLHLGVWYTSLTWHIQTDCRVVIQHPRNIKSHLQFCGYLSNIQSWLEIALDRTFLRREHDVLLCHSIRSCGQCHCGIPMWAEKMQRKCERTIFYSWEYLARGWLVEYFHLTSCNFCLWWSGGGAQIAKWYHKNITFHLKMGCYLW